MKIAIIGSGASGLTAIKCCLNEGIHPVCFEREDDIGGLWNYTPERTEGATVYRSTIINTSKEMMCYSDFPIPKEFPNYMHNTKVLEYFRLYEERFQLHSYIRFHTNVVQCMQADGFAKNGQWKVVSKNVKSGEEKSEYYDGILVCIGHHAIPYFPKEAFPGIEDFKGMIMHSHDYRDVVGFADKKVAIIGIGNSGGDIAVELGKYSEQVFLSTRRGTWVLNRVEENGMPLDVTKGTRWFMTLRKILPQSFVNSAIEKILNQRMDHEKYGLKPDYSPFSQHPMVNDEMANRILSGGIRVKPNIVRMKENGVVFDDGTEEKVDVVIFATGYSIKYPFLDESVLKIVENRCDLYKFVWPTTLAKNTLAIIGAIQPLGAINPIAEMQCRWATKVIKGDVALPSRERMMEEIGSKRAAMQKRYVNSRRHTIQVDYLDYMDEMAAEISCKPNLLKYLFTDPKLFCQLVFGPGVPYQYRLEGPGKWPEARHTIMTVKDRVLFPLQTRKVPMTEEKSSHLFWLFAILFAVFLAWCWMW